MWHQGAQGAACRLGSCHEQLALCPCLLHSTSLPCPPRPGAHLEARPHAFVHVFPRPAQVCGRRQAAGDPPVLERLRGCQPLVAVHRQQLVDEVLRPARLAASAHQAHQAAAPAALSGSTCRLAVSWAAGRCLDRRQCSLSAAGGQGELRRQPLHAEQGCGWHSRSMEGAHSADTLSHTGSSYWNVPLRMRLNSAGSLSSKKGG